LVALEPLLKRQRKAFITLKVEEKIDLTKDYQELIKHYMTALSKKDLTNASLLQSSLFDAVTNRDINYAIIGLIAIPKIKEFAQLINNDILFRYQSKETGDFIKEMEDASALDPSNSFIKFNLYNLQLNSWADGSIIVTNPDPIIKNIKALFTSKVDKKIVNQLYLNYYILVTDFYKTTNKFKYREESVALVKKYYKTIEASQQDINLLATFFMTHGKNEVALELLQPVIENGEYSEDILFTYLSITLNQYKNYEKYSTISLVNQAKELNNKRFCTLINGDKTKFQLFKSLPLKEAYCETCRE